MTMAAVDLDPVFVKALKLLHSKAKDSTAQLRTMVDDAIAQRKGLKPSSHYDFDRALAGKHKLEDESKKRELEKRSADKSVKDPSEPDVKKSKLDLKRTKEDKEYKEREKEKERARKEKERKDRDEKEAQRQREKTEKEKRDKEEVFKSENMVVTLSDDESSGPQMDAGDFALEMGIACIICKQFDQNTGNQLVECQECHSLYHQECHKPPVTDSEISDPRFVWYCCRCARSLKKMVAQKPVKPKPTLPAPGAIKDSIAPGGKISKPDLSSASQAFRRIDPKAMATPESSSLSSKPMVGLAGLAANLAKPRHDSKSGSSSRKDSSSKSSKSDSKSGYKSDTSSKSESKSGYKSDITSKSETKSGYKSDSSSKSTYKADGSKPSGKTEEKSSKSKEERDKKSESSSKSSKHDEPSISRSLSSSSHSKDDKKTDSKSVTWDKSDSKKLPHYHESSKGDSSSSKSSSSTSSKTNTSSSSIDSNKQAVANLSMVTANKRMQMMKKKAQTKPQDKKIHIK